MAYLKSDKIGKVLAKGSIIINYRIGRGIQIETLVPDRLLSKMVVKLFQDVK